MLNMDTFRDDTPERLLIFRAVDHAALTTGLAGRRIDETRTLIALMTLFLAAAAAALWTHPSTSAAVGYPTSQNFVPSYSVPPRHRLRRSRTQHTEGYLYQPLGETATGGVCHRYPGRENPHGTAVTKIAKGAKAMVVTAALTSCKSASESIPRSFNQRVAPK